MIIHQQKQKNKVKNNKRNNLSLKLFSLILF
jgi:hypothetical protein